MDAQRQPEDAHQCRQPRQKGLGEGKRNCSGPLKTRIADALQTRYKWEKKSEERRIERGILKEMFPYEASTSTGIRASCRRPIKGAAGRPLELSNFRMEESFSSKCVPKYAPLADVKSEKTKKGRSIPMGIKMLLFVTVAGFRLFVFGLSSYGNQPRKSLL